jgi:hypothetical protein
MTAQPDAWLQARLCAFLERYGPTAESQLAAYIAPEPPADTAHAPAPVHPLLSRAFDLSDDERALLWVTAGPLLFGQLANAYAAIGLHPPTLPTLCLLACPAPTQANALLQRLMVGHSDLLRYGLLRFEARSVGEPHVRLAPDILSALISGQPSEPAHSPIGPCAWPEPAQAQLSQQLERGVPTIITGERTTGRLEAIAAAHGALDVYPVPLNADAPEPGLAQALRRARLAGHHLVVQLDAHTEHATTRPPIRWVIRQAQPITLLLGHDSAIPPSLIPELQIIRAPKPDPAHAELAWHAALTAAALAPDLAPSLARRFPMSEATIHQIVRRAAAHQPRDLQALYSHIHAHRPHALGELADHFTTELTWSDVALPKATLAQLHEIVAYARNRTQVFSDPHYGRLMPYGRGLSCLFAGPPGTGKTMMAGVLAHSLGQELYRVDISKIASKWLGETEKHLARLFDEAERAGAILFFDEADSLFAKRTDVRGSNDRYANMEVNFLLQRMERYDGMSILATNLQQGLDVAFKRRMRFVVHFERPDATQRTALWQKMAPKALTGDPTVNFASLGKQYKFSGAIIKNAVIRAAFAAADEQRPLSQRHLVDAAQTEQAAQGRL